MRKTFTLILTVLLIPASVMAEWTGRNNRLRDLPDYTWFKVCKYNGASEALGGSSEVPWTYDANSRLFVRVGGCTGGYTNAVVLFDLGTETTTAPWGGWDITGPTNRPGGGCQRGLGYDPVTKIIYEMGGGASSDYGVYGFWKGDMAAGTWTQYRPKDGFGGQVQVAADTANRVIVHAGRASSGFRHLYLYYPDGDSLVQAPVRPGSADLESVIGHDWWPTMQYAPGLGGTMYFAWMNGVGWFTWLFDAKTRTWTDLNPTGLENSPAVADYVSQGFRSVLSWDNASNVMLLHIPNFGIYVYNPSANRWDKVAETNPQALGSQMFDYDDEHNVHVMASYNYAYDQDIWAFRYRNTGSSAVQAAPAKTTRAGLSLDCVPNPFQTRARITFHLGQASKVTLGLYDIQGRLRQVLLRETREPGAHSIPLANDRMAPGVYMIRLDAGPSHMTMRVFIGR